MSWRGDGCAARGDHAQRGEVDVVGLGVPEQVAPDGGYPGREGGTVPGDDGRQGGGLEELLGHDQVRPGQHGRVRGAPGVGVEHRHDREHAVPFVRPERRRRADSHRVQVGRAVAVDDSLGIARGPRRVAHGRGLPLVELGPVVARLLPRQQLLVGQGLPERGGVALAHHHDVLDRGQLVADPGQQPGDGGVHDDDPVLGVVDDVGELFGEEPQVEGVEDRAHGGDREIGLEVGLVVPEEGADPVRVSDPEPAERLGQPLGPPGHLGEGGGDRLALGPDDGHDPAVRVDRLAVAEDPADQQRAVLHGAEHRRLPCCHRAPGQPSLPTHRAQPRSEVLRGPDADGGLASARHRRRRDGFGALPGRPA